MRIILAGAHKDFVAGTLFLMPRYELQHLMEKILLEHICCWKTLIFEFGIVKYCFIFYENFFLYLFLLFLGIFPNMLQLLTKWFINMP